VVAPIASDAAEWGRVTEDGTVEVREGETWRPVGQYPDGTADEALAYFARKYDDLAVKLGTLETRAQNGGASASDLTKQATHLRGEATDAAAVGDLVSLRERIETLLASLAEATAKESAAAMKRSTPPSPSARRSSRRPRRSPPATCRRCSGSRSPPR